MTDSRTALVTSASSGIGRAITELAVPSIIAHPLP
jgi:NAD(P)-dependent dehydrogenase (short-subunit alcohol dehydrogenase family)